MCPYGSSRHIHSSFLSLLSSGWSGGNLEKCHRGHNHWVTFSLRGQGWLESANVFISTFTLKSLSHPLPPLTWLRTFGDRGWLCSGCSGLEEGACCSSGLSYRSPVMVGRFYAWAVSIVTITSVWLLSTWNGASVTEELKFLVRFKCKQLHRLVATVLNWIGPDSNVLLMPGSHANYTEPNPTALGPMWLSGGRNQVTDVECWAQRKCLKSINCHPSTN